MVGRVYRIVETLLPPGGDRPFLGLWGMPLSTWFDISAFRPLVTSTQEADTAMFLSLLKSTDPLDRALMLLDEFEL